MEDGDPRRPMSAPWHQILADIPKDARINRRSAIAAELARQGNAGSLAEWESLSVELTDGNAGLRHVIVTVDGKGRPLSANDLALYRRGLEDGRVEVRTESIGGRIEVDGRFFGTRWTSIGYEERSTEDDTGIESKASEPTDADVERLLALVRDVLKRRPPKPQRPARARGRVLRDKSG
jgi:hypothetical protein